MISDNLRSIEFLVCRTHQIRLKSLSTDNSSTSIVLSQCETAQLNIFYTVSAISTLHPILSRKFTLEFTIKYVRDQTCKYIYGYNKNE